ncbi:MAG: PIN domain-containing protein [Patescibacteria group bacterium]
MTNKFVDTNIFIEIFTRRGQKSDLCKKLADSDNSLTTNILVFSEVEWVLRSFYEMERDIVTKCLKIILSSKIEIENKNVLINCIDYYKNNNVDWTDCLNMFLVKEMEISKVYSYDKGLNKFNWIKRLEP